MGATGTMAAGGTVLSGCAAHRVPCIGRLGHASTRHPPPRRGLAGFIADAFEARGAEFSVHMFPGDGPLPALDGTDHVVVLGAV